ncbi:hypothetical protein [Clostridium beijerinckii]|uniref:hypothetical protein n=1 Tax=Clostridium beijerinckii TaxID=1520 RepID=UPI001494A141|nr:hypothetical protein [Clostridium beijerinckii]
MKGTKEDLYKVFLTYTTEEFLEKIASSADENERKFYVGLYNMVLSKEQQE